MPRQRVLVRPFWLKQKRRPTTTTTTTRAVGSKAGWYIASECCACTPYAESSVSLTKSLPKPRTWASPRHTGHHERVCRPQGKFSCRWCRPCPFPVRTVSKCRSRRAGTCWHGEAQDTSGQDGPKLLFRLGQVDGATLTGTGEVHRQAYFVVERKIIRSALPSGGSSFFFSLPLLPFKRRFRHFGSGSAPSIVSVSHGPRFNNLLFRRGAPRRKSPASSLQLSSSRPVVPKLIPAPDYTLSCQPVNGGPGISLARKRNAAHIGLEAHDLTQTQTGTQGPGPRTRPKRPSDAIATPTPRLPSSLRPSEPLLFLLTSPVTLQSTSSFPIRAHPAAVALIQGSSAHLVVTVPLCRQASQGSQDPSRRLHCTQHANVAQSQLTALHAAPYGTSSSTPPFLFHLAWSLEESNDRSCLCRHTRSVLVWSFCPRPDRPCGVSALGRTCPWT